MNLFIIEKIENGFLILSEEESYHLVKVLKIRQGEEVFATDKKGNFWRARVEIISKKQIGLLPIRHQPNYKKSSFYLHLAIALPKSSQRFEWLLEKITEIGLSEISPIITDCSHRQKKINLPRANKIIASAMKQSLRAYLPTLNEPVSLGQFFEMQNKKQTQSLKYIAHCNENFPRNSLKELTSNQKQIHSNFVLLIGPEGDFSHQEIEKATILGYKGLKLSEFRLRLETAAFVALEQMRFSLEN